MHHNWCSFDLQPERFWHLVPKEVKREIDAAVASLKRKHNENAWLAWHTAVIGRVKKVPNLKELFASDIKLPVQADWKDDFANMAAWVMTSSRKH